MGLGVTREDICLYDVQKGYPACWDEWFPKFRQMSLSKDVDAVTCPDCIDIIRKGKEEVVVWPKN